MDFSNFRNLLQNQLPWVIIFAGTIYLIKHFKDQSWVKFVSVLLMCTIVIAFMKGADFTSVVRAILGWFGINI